MNSFIEQIDYAFNLDKAMESAYTYSNSVGIGAIVIDIYGQILYETNSSKSVCGFCREMMNGQNQKQNCSSAHLLYGSYQAERFGGKYVFFCPLGLVHWASPISIDGIMRGAVLGGPVSMIEPEDFLIDDIIKKNNIEETYIEELKQYIFETPIISTDRVNSLSELLFIVSTNISDSEPSRYIEEREFQDQQSSISEYIHHIKTMGGSENDTQSYPLEKEKELLSLISLGDKSGSQKILNEIFGHIFFSSGGDFPVIKSRILELVVLLSRAALEGGADIELIFGLNYKYLSEIHEFYTVEELTFWLSKIMIRFTDCVFNLADVKHIDVIYRAINYIKQYYMKRITLEEVSSKVYLSPSYFSKIFKEEMKYSFIAYLNHVRIEMSKKILTDDSVNLIDVPAMVGYEDQSYFSKVFKKVTGISPGKYREMRGGYKKL